MSSRPLKVFLCHAHADRDAVRALYTRLTNDGVDAWLDKEKLLPGQDWELEIKKAVREADVVVVCLSKLFNQAGFRQKEVRLALDTAMEQPEGEIFIIPARLEECDTLESLRKWHWVDLFEDDGYVMLKRALRARADRIGATLQVKKSWLLKVTAPRKTDEPVVEKKPVEKNQKTSTLEKPKPEKQHPKKTKLPRKLNTAIVVALIGLAGTIVAALIGYPILIRFFTPVATPTIFATNAPSQVLQLTQEIDGTSQVSLTATSTLPVDIVDDQCQIILFDDFSTDKKWVNNSEQKSVVTRDPTDEWLYWITDRQIPLHFFYPIDVNTNHLSLEFRFLVEGGSGTVLWVGFAESLNQVDPVNGGDLPGVFLAPNHIDHIEFLSMYSNRDYTFYDTEIDYGGYGRWVKAVLTINDLSWGMEIWDDKGNLLGLDGGALIREYSGYNYIMLMFDYGGEYATMTGYLDDIKVCDLQNQ